MGHHKNYTTTQTCAVAHNIIIMLCTHTLQAYVVMFVRFRVSRLGTYDPKRGRLLHHAYTVDNIHTQTHSDEIDCHTTSDDCHTSDRRRRVNIYSTTASWRTTTGDLMGLIS